MSNYSRTLEIWSQYTSQFPCNKFRQWINSFWNYYCRTLTMHPICIFSLWKEQWWKPYHIALCLLFIDFARKKNVCLCVIRTSIKCEQIIFAIPSLQIYKNLLFAFLYEFKGSQDKIETWVYYADFINKLLTFKL